MLMHPTRKVARVAKLEALIKALRLYIIRRTSMTSRTTRTVEETATAAMALTVSNEA